VPWALVLLVTAAYFWFATPKAGAVTHCVGTAAELQTALDEAAINWTNDYILVQRGTYTGNFQFGSYQHWPITIRGGYDPTCTTRVDDPSSTILDAEDSGTVLSLYQHAGGGVHVEGLTLQNGGYHGLWVRLINEYDDSTIEGIQLIKNVIKDGRGKSGVYMMSEPDQAYADPILVYDNIIVGNSVELSGITVIAQWTFLGSNVVLRNNLVAGNMSTNTYGGVSISNYSKGNVYLTNNTIVDNETLAAIAIPGGLNVGVGDALYAYNNIIRGNLSANGVEDLAVNYFDSSGTGNGFNNDYGEMSGSWTLEGQNQNVDPGFVSPGFWHDNGTVSDPADDYWVTGDYHLGPGSPCIDAGSHDAPGLGALPPEDFEGDPRVVDGNSDQVAIVDIGADEYAVILVSYPGTAPCNTTLQACIDGTPAGEVIEIATDTPIDETLTIEKSLTLQSNPGFTGTIGGGDTSREIRVRDAGPGGGVVIVNLRNLRLDRAGVDVQLDDESGHWVSVKELEITNPWWDGGFDSYVSVPATLIVEHNKITTNGAVVDLMTELSAPGVVTLKVAGNILTAAVPENSGSGIDLSLRGTGSVTASFLSNVIYGVTGCNCGGASGIKVNSAFVLAGLSATVNITNNTLDDLQVASDGIDVEMRDPEITLTVNIYNNIVTRATRAGITLPDFSPGLSVNNSHNDFFDNARPDDFGGYAAGPVTLNVDPRYFAPDSGHHQLRDDSPLINLGNNWPPGGLPAQDAEQQPRVVGLTVDFGGYEHPSVVTLFADGFESGDTLAWSNTVP
jgi:hypothetical protein